MGSERFKRGGNVDDTIIIVTGTGQFTLAAWHETTTIYIHTYPLTTTHDEPYNKTSRLGQEMEDTRRERKVAQEIIVQHINRHASEALVALPKTARLIGVSAERYLKISIDFGDAPQGSA
jgi:hypothetical protein